MSSTGEVDEVCQEIASGLRCPGSPPVWLGGRAWQVLDVVGTSRALLLADRVVARRPYHKKQVPITWEECDLRRWLNDEFRMSLGEPLASRALTVKVHNEPSPAWGTDGGEDTDDRFFLLSAREAAIYFTGAEPSTWDEYCEVPRLGARGIAIDERGRRVWWWLRSPGRTLVHAAYVLHVGDLIVGGRTVSSSAGVRPAFWLNLCP